MGTRLARGAGALVLAGAVLASGLQNAGVDVGKLVHQGAGWVVAMSDAKGVSSEQRRELASAADMAAARIAREGRPALSNARSAHQTNTPEQMTAALRDGYDFVEGDVRLRYRVDLPLLEQEPYMGHVQDAGGMSLRNWLQYVKRSGVGLKIDLKASGDHNEPSSEPLTERIFDEIRAANLPPDQPMIFNADVLLGPGAVHGVVLETLDDLFRVRISDDVLVRARAAFPRAIINVGVKTGRAPEGTTYSAADVAAMIRVAQRVGGPIQFPLRADFVTPEIVAQLAPYGAVGVWRTEAQSPAEVRAEQAKFARWGVNGIVDLAVRRAN